LDTKYRKDGQWYLTQMWSIILDWILNSTNDEFITEKMFLIKY